MTDALTSVGRRIGIVGAGTMGIGIAEVAARSGCQVMVVDVVPSVLHIAPDRLASSIARAARKGLLNEPASDVCARVTFSTELASLSDRELIHEAIREDREAKAELITALDAIVDPRAIIASNTSSIPIAWLARASVHPDRVLGLHFFNPVPQMPLVELIPSLLTGEPAQHTAFDYAAGTLGKTVIRAPDRSGFIVNALLVPYLLSAIRMLENGVAAREEIDAGMVSGCGMPMGPLALCDLIGLDTMLAIAETLFVEFGDPACVAPSLLRRHVDAGLLGRKSGRGFYDYSPA